jgi:MFS family permease
MAQLPIYHPSLHRRHLESIALDDTERKWTLIALTLATGAAYWSNAASFLLVADISGNLGASFNEGVWLITTYITAYAIGIALSHRLTSYFGNRRLLFFSCIAFAIGSLGQSCSGNLPIFLVFRVIAGVAGGAFILRSLIFLTHRYERSQRVAPLRNFGVGFLSIGMVIAPIASGWLSDQISWRLAFVAVIPLINRSLSLPYLCSGAVDRGGRGPQARCCRHHTADFERGDTPGSARPG